MTEAEWLAETNFKPMLEFLCGGPIDALRPWYAHCRPGVVRRTSEHKLRLLACACARAAARRILDWDRADPATLTFGAGWS